MGIVCIHQLFYTHSGTAHTFRRQCSAGRRMLALSAGCARGDALYLSMVCCCFVLLAAKNAFHPPPPKKKTNAFLVRGARDSSTYIYIYIGEYSARVYMGGQTTYNMASPTLIPEAKACALSIYTIALVLRCGVRVYMGKD